MSRDQHADRSDRHEADHRCPEAERRNDAEIPRDFAQDRLSLKAHRFPPSPFIHVWSDLDTPHGLTLRPSLAAKSSGPYHPALTRRRSAGISERRAISRSSQAASSALTSIIGERTSLEAISPVCASQYFAGAGLGSVNNSRVSSATSCQLADAASRSPAFRWLCTRAKVSVATWADSRMAPSVSASKYSASSPVSTRKPSGLRRNRSIDCARSAEQSFMPTMFGCCARRSSVSLARLPEER